MGWFEVNHYHHVVPPKGQEDRLKSISDKLDFLTLKFNEMTPELQRLTDEVAETKTLAGSAITLLGNLSRLIRERANDPAAINALADELDGENKRIAAAIQENTPSEGEPGSGEGDSENTNNGGANAGNV